MSLKNFWSGIWLAAAVFAFDWLARNLIGVASVIDVEFAMLAFFIIGLTGGWPITILATEFLVVGFNIFFVISADASSLAKVMVSVLVAGMWIMWRRFRTPIMARLE